MNLYFDISRHVQKSLNPMCVCPLRWGLGFPRLVIKYDLQHAAGSGVSEGPPRGIRGAARPAGGTWDVCTNHWDGWVNSSVFPHFVKKWQHQPTFQHSNNVTTQDEKHNLRKGMTLLSSVFAVLRRIKVTFIDTIVRIEHQPLDLETGVALEVHIKRYVLEMSCEENDYFSVKDLLIISPLSWFCVFFCILKFGTSTYKMFSLSSHLHFCSYSFLTTVEFIALFHYFFTSLLE